MTELHEGDFTISGDELRAVVQFSVDCATGLLRDFEVEVLGDLRPRDALNAARKFAEGAERTKLQRTAAFAAHRAAKEAPSERAQLAAQACGDAAAAAYLHPIGKATQVGHILRAAACSARSAELKAGDDPTAVLEVLNELVAKAPQTVVDVLKRYPSAPEGKSRVAELMVTLDQMIRARK